MPNSQLNKLKSGIKYGTEINILIIENNFPHKLLLANIQLHQLIQIYQLHKIGQSKGFLGRILGPLLKTGLSLVRNILKPLAKSVLIPLELTAAASAANAAITARKTILSFSRRPEKTVFPKKLRWNLIFLVLLGKIIFLFPENMILPTNGK